MIRRTHTGEADLALLQDFNAAAIAAADQCGYLHPRDIPHHIYNGNKYYDPAEIMTIWEDDRGVAAWLLLDLGHRSFDAQVRPDLRGGDFEQAPEGTFAALPIVWFDRLNRTRLFEPVGAHKDHRRRGRGRAILMYGMQQMVAAGMEFPTVAQ